MSCLGRFVRPFPRHAVTEELSLSVVLVVRMSALSGRQISRHIRSDVYWYWASHSVGVGQRKQPLSSDHDGCHTPEGVESHALQLPIVLSTTCHNNPHCLSHG